jgi:hypothetical protein
MKHDPLSKMITMKLERLSKLLVAVAALITAIATLISAF